MISTYALCGFANVGSMGIMMGSLWSLAPDKRDNVASMILRALIAGNVVSFLNACTAGEFYTMMHLLAS